MKGETVGVIVGVQFVASSLVKLFADFEPRWYGMKNTFHL